MCYLWVSALTMIRIPLVEGDFVFLITFFPHGGLSGWSGSKEGLKTRFTAAYEKDQARVLDRLEGLLKSVTRISV